MKSNISNHKYRPDIDGLRAIAILVVVVFHYFPSAVPGGFIGVDIFFVISGYLISTIIYEALDKNVFSFTLFYSRRIRRIFPALILVLATCFLVGWFSFTAIEYKQLGKHIAAAATFLSNIILWGEAGYFDNASDTKPLLHLWSLGIEEQYYIAWPLIVWLTWRFKLNLYYLTLILVATSLYSNIHDAKIDIVAAFYFPHSRAWELLSGSLLAYIQFYEAPVITKRVRAVINKVSGVDRVGADLVVANLCSFTGMALIIIGLLVIGNNESFSNGQAILPVLGSFCLIAGGMNAWVNRKILSKPVLQWIGLISYPLYLWHWPLISMTRVYLGKSPELNLKVILVLVSFFLAWMTHHLIEHPLRYGEYLKSKSIGLILAMLLLGALGFYSYLADGVVSRENSAFISVKYGSVDDKDFYENLLENYFQCTDESLLERSPKWNEMSRCFQSKQSDDVDVAIIGDSHGEHMFIGLANALTNKNVSYYIQGTLPDIDNRNFHHIFDYVLNNDSIEIVILSSFWQAYMNNMPDGLTLRDVVDKTVRSLVAENKKVYLVDDGPFFSFDPENCKYSRLFQKPTCSGDERNFRFWYNKWIVDLEYVAIKNDAKLIRSSDYLCQGTFCTMSENNMVLYRDRNHLNVQGSNYMAKKILAEFGEMNR